jgi:hypothetical protein
MTPGIVLLIMCGLALVGLCAVQALIALLRAFIPVVPITVAQTVANALPSALRSGRDVAPTIEAVALHLRWPHTWRARSAAAALAADPAAGIIATLASHRLLPSALATSGSAAERLGQPALVRWASALAALPNWAETLFKPLALYAGLAVLVVVLVAFVEVFIIPKFEWLARDLGTRLDGRLVWLTELAAMDVLAWMCIPLIAVLIGLVCAWRWRRMRRVLAAETILAGTASGASEGEIAGSLAGDAVSVAGAAGDFSALAAAAGWPGVADPTDLAVQMEATAERSRRQRVGVRIVLQIALPLILAMPVWLLATGIFATLVNFINTVGDGGLS